MYDDFCLPWLDDCEVYKSERSIRLFHGTRASLLDDVLKDGLQPRRFSGRMTNWPDNPSSPDGVYLSRLYAPYFAAAAAGDTDEKWMLVEVDWRNLPLLLPDEDFLEQATRTQRQKGEVDMPDVPVDMQGATAWFREKLLHFRDEWKNSVQYLGNCVAYGYVPPQQIKACYVFDWDRHRAQAFDALDPTITLVNAQLCWHKYLFLTEDIVRVSEKFVPER
jgi:hypothetical protein